VFVRAFRKALRATELRPVTYVPIGIGWEKNVSEGSAQPQPDSGTAWRGQTIPSKCHNEPQAT
jgi:hypothetical protein